MTETALAATVQAAVVVKLKRGLLKVPYLGNQRRTPRAVAAVAPADRRGNSYYCTS